MLFRGTAPALVTPFTADDRFDEEAFRRLLDFQIEGGVEALVVLGTTGENPTVTDEERARVVEVAVGHVAGRVPVVIGTGTNDTAHSIRHSKGATEAGADALLVVGPYYNKPTQNGFIAHVSAIAEATDLPIILYNVPSRTGSNITAETMLRMADEVPTLAGVKEASGNMAQIVDLLAGRPERLAVYSGDDELTLAMLALGADGLISVVANALPAETGELVRAGLAGDFERARRLHFELLEPMRACFVESNPIPIKTVLGRMGLINPHLRLPLVPLEEQHRARLEKAFGRAGIQG